MKLLLKNRTVVLALALAADAVCWGTLILVVMGSIGCSTAKVRNLETDPELRVFLDPSIEVSHYVQIRRALVQSGKFEVVDRAEGFAAAVSEQERQHALTGRRFSDKEKWAWIGEFYGAAAVVTAHAQCFNRHNFWGKYVKTCKQELAFINVSNGKVALAVNAENSEEAVVGYSVPDWNDAVEKLVAVYPKYYKPRVIRDPLDTYMDQSEERAKREREFRDRAEVPKVPASVSNGLELVRQANQQIQQQQQVENPHAIQGAE